MLDTSHKGVDLVDFTVAHTFNELAKHPGLGAPDVKPAIFKDSGRQTRALTILEDSVLDNASKMTEDELSDPETFPLPSPSATEHVTDIIDLSQAVEDNKYDDKLPELLKSTHFASEVQNVLRSWSNALHQRIEDKPHAGAFVYLDLDNFKRINDTYGHTAGDEVLSLLSRCMSETMRPVDKLGRHGGEEFMIWFSDSSVDALGNAFWEIGDESGEGDGMYIRINTLFHQKLEKIKAKYGMAWEPLLVNGKPTYFSAGLSTISSSELVPGEEKSAYDSILRQADGIMYANKARRRLERKQLGI